MSIESNLFIQGIFISIPQFQSNNDQPEPQLRVPTYSDKDNSQVNKNETEKKPNLCSHLHNF